MVSSVITVAGTKYAAGLYWQPSPEAKNIAQAAKEAAKQPGFQADFFCIREPSKSQPIAQFGLGIESAGHKQGMPSIAACLVNQKVGSWAGAFRVTEGIYFIAVREDLIDPDGDILFTNENEAQARLEQEISRGGLTDILCPPEWGVHRSQSSQISALLAGNKSNTLKRVNADFKMLAQLGILIVLLGLGYGIFTFVADQIAKQKAEDEAQQAAMEKAMRLRKAAKEYPKTWQDNPVPIQFLQACGDAMDAAAPRYLGWLVSSIECTPNGLKIVWTRTGTGSAVVPADGKATVDSSFTTGTLSVPIPTLTPRGEEQLGYYGLVDQMLAKRNLPAVLAPLPDDTLPASPDKDAPPPPPSKWRKRSIIYTFKGAPWHNGELFDSIPGLIITSVKSQGNLSSFTVEGIIYENKEP